MRMFSMYRVELRRLVLSKATVFTALLCLCAPLLGYLPLFQTSSIESLSIQLIANPVLAGTFTGAVIWAVFHLVEISRPRRSGTDALTNAVVSGVRLAIVRMSAMAALLLAVTILGAGIYLPYTAAKMEYLFHPAFYFANFVVFQFPTWMVSVLFVEAFYQITCRIELSVMLYGVCAYVSFSGFASEDYFMRWLNPYVVSYYCKEHYGALGQLKDDRLLLRQKSIMVMSGYAHPGICEWFETVLSPLALKDPQKGASAKEVFIHEMIHQWWGAFGLEFQEEELWSSEGLTVYSTYRLVKEKYGELYARQYYVDAWKEAVEKQERNFYNRHPEYLAALPEFYQIELRSANEGANLYMRMPLMILKAQEFVGGEEKMDEILRNMYRDRENFDYDHPFSYQDFLDYCGLEQEDLEIG